MKTMKHLFRTLLTGKRLWLFASALLALDCGTSAFAGYGNLSNPRILPPSSHPHGKSYDDWGGSWWQWASSFPIGESPIVDQTGAAAGLGQSGSVWFLAGNAGGATTRSITIPPGKTLLIPILNSIYLGFPCDDRNLPGCEIDQALEAANDLQSLFAFIDPLVDGATLTCQIDGQSVKNLPLYRTHSEAIYSLSLPEDNIYGLPAGPYHPCVDTGIYLLLSPLPPGIHTIHFTADDSGTSLSLDVTYHLAVLPK